MNVAYVFLLVLAVSKGLSFPHQNRAQIVPPLWWPRQTSSSELQGWLDNFLPAPIDSNDENQRRQEFPEQYLATYEMNEATVNSDSFTEEAAIVRPLLKQTMLESRPLKIAYDANLHGWSAHSFHGRVDGKGAAIVIATYQDMSKSPYKRVAERIVGGYNPKGWSSNGGARPSVAAFLFYERDNDGQVSRRSKPTTFQKLQKVGGGGLACSNDNPNYGISFGPDALVIPLQPSSRDETEGQQEERREKFASSKLGPYFERGPDDISSLFERRGGGVIDRVQLESLKVLTGTYSAGEDIPYSGAVVDMTSG
mmetsp:Transcript_2171/g.3222  ORF Transcript_2171/g.3222 Transcript_2171/m.3222 type:complete len:310 (-) Transcript_2171:1638-2567(-)